MRGVAWWGGGRSLPGRQQAAAAGEGASTAAGWARRRAHHTLHSCGAGPWPVETSRRIFAVKLLWTMMLKGVMPATIGGLSSARQEGEGGGEAGTLLPAGGAAGRGAPAPRAVEEAAAGCDVRGDGGAEGELLDAELLLEKVGEAADL